MDLSRLLLTVLYLLFLSVLLYIRIASCSVLLAQIDSMVEIKHEPASSSGAQTPNTLDERKHRLVYSKSKVYVNPTAYARDNIPGFVTLVKRVCAFTKMFDRALIQIAGGSESDIPPCVDSRGFA